MSGHLSPCLEAGFDSSINGELRCDPAQGKRRRSNNTVDSCTSINFRTIRVSPDPVIRVTASIFDPFLQVWFSSKDCPFNEVPRLPNTRYEAPWEGTENWERDVMFRIKVSTMFHSRKLELTKLPNDTALSGRLYNGPYRVRLTCH